MVLYLVLYYLIFTYIYTYIFNIYDIFFFINETSLANYADDNTPYTMDEDIDELLNTLLIQTYLKIGLEIITSY